MRYAGRLLLSLAMVGGASSALAPGAVAPAALAYDGTQSEQEACTPDVFSLCSAFIPNEDPILACLKEKRAQLSPACANVLFPPRRGRRTRS